MKRRKKESNCGPAAGGPPGRASLQFLFGNTMSLFSVAAVLLILSSRACVTAGDTDSMPEAGGVVLPIARQALASGDVNGHLRRRSLLAAKDLSANFSLPLEGAIKDYG